jgi:hypothetical protein
MFPGISAEQMQRLGDVPEDQETVFQAAKRVGLTPRQVQEVRQYDHAAVAWVNSHAKN